MTAIWFSAFLKRGKQKSISNSIFTSALPLNRDSYIVSKLIIAEVVAEEAEVNWNKCVFFMQTLAIHEKNLYLCSEFIN